MNENECKVFGGRLAQASISVASSAVCLVFGIGILLYLGRLEQITSGGRQSSVVARGRQPVTYEGKPITAPSCNDMKTYRQCPLLMTHYGGLI
jgi:hypothetical protein